MSWGRHRAANAAALRAGSSSKISRPEGTPPPVQTFRNRLTFSLLETIAVPTLLMTGDADLYSPPAVLRLSAARIRNSESVIVPEVGHSTYWEQPELFNQKVWSSFAGTDLVHVAAHRSSFRYGHPSHASDARGDRLRVGWRRSVRRGPHGQRCRNASPHSWERKRRCGSPRDHGQPGRAAGDDTPGRSRGCEPSLTPCGTKRVAREQTPASS